MGVLNYSQIVGHTNYTYTHIPQAPNVISMSPTTEALLIAAVCFGIFSIVMSIVSKRNKHRVRTKHKLEQEQLKKAEELKRSEENKRKFENESNN